MRGLDAWITGERDPHGPHGDGGLDREDEAICRCQCHVTDCGLAAEVCGRCCPVMERDREDERPEEAPMREDEDA